MRHLDCKSEGHIFSAKRWVGPDVHFCNRKALGDDKEVDNMFLTTMQQTLETGLFDRGIVPEKISVILRLLETPEAVEEMYEWLENNETEPLSEIMLEAIFLWDKYNDPYSIEDDLMECA